MDFCLQGEQTGVFHKLGLESEASMKRLRLRTVLFCLLLTACYQDSYGPMRGWDHMMMFGYGYGGMFMWLIFLIIIGLLIYFIVQNQKTKGPSSKSPLDILKERYAKGEITKEDFDKMKKDL